MEEARGLRDRGYEVEVYAPTVDYKNCFPEFLQDLKVKMLLPSFIDRLPYRNAIRMVATSFLAPILVLKFRKTDLFIGANQPGAWIAFCMAKILKKPYLVYLNQPNRIIYPRPVDVDFGWATTVADYHFLFNFFQYLKPLLMVLDRYSIRASDCVMVNGSYIGDVIANVYSHKVIDNPSGSYAYSQGNKIKNYILMTNRHDPQKRFDYVIKAFAKVSKRQRTLKLLIPGPFTDHTKKLTRLVKKLDLEQKVLFLGKISESKLQTLYKHAKVYCYPSPEEDFGLGPLEAGGWGVPTVAWNHGGPTVTVADGVTGFLAQPYDINDFASKVEKIVTDKNLRNKMGRAAFLRTMEHFSWNRHLDVMETEIKRLLK